MNKHDFYWKYVERPKRFVSSKISRLMKWNNPILIQKEVNKMRNEVVLRSFAVVRLLGWTDQYEDDYYWVIYDLKNGVELYTCVGGFTRLKWKLGGFHYYHLESGFSLNSPPLEKILLMVKEKGIILK